jgi:hypothetical protein
MSRMLQTPRRTAAVMFQLARHASSQTTRRALIIGSDGALGAATVQRFSHDKWEVVGVSHGWVPCISAIDCWPRGCSTWHEISMLHPLASGCREATSKDDRSIRIGVGASLKEQLETVRSRLKA